MSDTDKAYAAAERLIEEAKRNRATALSFNTVHTWRLESLPSSILELSELRQLDLRNTRVPEISALGDLKQLHTLWLSNSHVTDITPLGTMVQLSSLWMDNTRITDLRPLLSLSQLYKRPNHMGLNFFNCQAAQQDPSIAKIAAIKDDKKRAQSLFGYLKDWQPSGTVE